jgi:glycosyltransferase involved in cell wall biosynthesis
VLCNEFESAEPITRFVAEHGPIPGLNIVFVERSTAERLLARLPGFYYFAYNLWHRRAYLQAIRLHRRHHFDVVHQVTLCGYREPGYLWKLDAPFVWGPVGGTQNYPWRFLFEAGPIGLVSEGLRNLANALQLRLSPRVRQSARRAAKVFAANSTNRADFQRVLGVQAERLLETGLNEVVGHARPVESGRPLRILWSGTFTSNKALSLLLKALAGLQPTVAFELRVYGEGPCERRWRRLARSLGLEGQVAWMGWVPHKEVLAAYGWADVFVFTSLRDTSGNAILEALGNGVPVVCLAHQGAGDIVTSSCGVPVTVTTPREVVLGIRQALMRMTNPEEMSRLRNGATERAREFLWARNAETMATAYHVVARSAVGRACRPLTQKSALEPGSS